MGYAAKMNFIACYDVINVYVNVFAVRDVALSRASFRLVEYGQGAGKNLFFRLKLMLRMGKTVCWKCFPEALLRQGGFRDASVACSILQFLIESVFWLHYDAF